MCSALFRFLLMFSSLEDSNLYVRLSLKVYDTNRASTYVHFKVFEEMASSSLYSRWVKSMVSLNIKEFCGLLVAVKEQKLQRVRSDTLAPLLNDAEDVPPPLKAVKRSSTDDEETVN